MLIDITMLNGLSDLDDLIKTAMPQQPMAMARVFINPEASHDTEGRLLCGLKCCQVAEYLQVWIDEYPTEPQWVTVELCYIGYEVLRSGNLVKLLAKVVVC